MTPSTITEANGKFTVHNARPRAMRVVVAIAAPIVVIFVGISILGDVRDSNWIMIAPRALFALMVLLAAQFSLFGAESIGVEGGELVWRRGTTQERRYPLGDVERLERQGNQLHVHVRSDRHPIIVGAGLRQPAAAMQWLADRLQAALDAARK